MKFTGKLGALPFSRRIGLAAGAGIVAIVAIAVLGSSGSSARSTATPAAHSFTLAALGHSGQQLSLSRYEGRPVLVNFFASWCAPCKKETPLLAGFYQAHHGRVAVLGIDVNDGTSAALQFVRRDGVGYPVASDPSATVAGQYGVVALPQTFFLNAAHQIVKRDFGPLSQASLTAGLAKMR